MSKNLLKLQLIVSYQGTTHDFKSTLDLDDVLSKSSNLPPLHDWIARVNKVDSYSYLFEVLQSETIIIEEATGLAADFVQNNEFNADGFIQAWRQEKALTNLNNFAEKYLEETLENNEPLKQTLLAAFSYGYEQGKTETLENL